MLRKALIGLIVLVSAGIAYRVLGVYKFRPGACSQTAAHEPVPSFPRRLLVMTWNIEGHATLIRGASHIEAIAETIRKYHPDVVVLNEAHRNTWQARFTDQVEALRLLTGMNGVFGPSYRFARGEFGNAILTRGDIRESTVYALPGIGEPRSMLAAVVAIDGGTIEVDATHTSAWGAASRDARTLQLACIRTHAGSSGYPAVLAGDLNASPAAPEIAEFLRMSRLRFAGDPARPTHKVTGQRLDYVLADPGWQVTSAHVIDEGPSDHRPVLVELTRE
jgi:endonuclease/exonuclease/phosphatase family metal-dependent hydrolase